MVGHYAAGARLIGLTENQLRKHMESLKARHAADDNKSPYAEPLHIVFGKVRDKHSHTPILITSISSQFLSHKVQAHPGASCGWALRSRGSPHRPDREPAKKAHGEPEGQARS